MISNKPFKVSNVRQIIDQYDREEISYSRMVELLNETAIQWMIKNKNNIPERSEERRVGKECA
jgi:hypothetical protein